MRSSQFFLKGALAATLVAAVSVSYAAIDGKKGRTSSGTVEVRMTIKNMLRISELSDIQVNDRWKSSGDKNNKFNGFSFGMTGVCVSSESSSIGYSIKASSSHSFNLSSGGSEIPYSLHYTARKGASTLDRNLVEHLDLGNKLNDGAAVGNGGGDFHTVVSADPDLGCGGAEKYNGQLWVKVEDSDISSSALQAGEYNDTVTVVVSPS